MRGNGAPSRSVLRLTMLRCARPWRAPGAAPVFDSCGVAGGHKPPEGSFGGIYVNTSHAKLGDLGSKVLPKTPTGVEWYGSK